jgi:hypothetical protein
MAALRGGHPGQHDEIRRVALYGRVKTGHGVDQANPTLNVIPAKAGIQANRNTTTGTKDPTM